MMREIYWRLALLRSRIVDAAWRRWYIHPFQALAVEGEFTKPRAA